MVEGREMSGGEGGSCWEPILEAARAFLFLGGPKVKIKEESKHGLASLDWVL